MNARRPGCQPPELGDAWAVGPKGLSSQAQATAIAAETLYREKRLSVSGIAGKLHISKSTLYRYLRERGVAIGPYAKPAQPRSDKPPEPSAQIAAVLLSLSIENNSSFVRGRKRVKDGLDRYLRHQYAAALLPSGQYRLKIPYGTDEELDNRMEDLLEHIGVEADLRHCFSESHAHLEQDSERHW